MNNTDTVAHVSALRTGSHSSGHSSVCEIIYIYKLMTPKQEKSAKSAWVLKLLEILKSLAATCGGRVSLFHYNV